MNDYKERLKELMDELVHLIYHLTKDFPKGELYGSTSQIRRAALSIILNYVEGFARIKPAVQLNFFEISFGSLKETQYLLKFSLEEKYILDGDFKKCADLSEEIGAMLWTEISALSKKVHGE